MKQLLMAVVVGTILAGTATVFAGEGCCMSKATSAKAGAKSGAPCGDALSKLKLTDDQKAKVAALEAECGKTACTETSRAKMIKGLEGILTADQLAEFKAEIAKTAKAEKPDKGS